MKTTYISDDNFRKLTKKQKLEIPMSHDFGEVEISTLVMIPSNRKSGGYYLGDFFAYTENKGWWRPSTYDCWQIVTEIDSPFTATPRFQILKGDFENGGVQIFGFVDEYHKAYISYGGRITIRKANKV